jgi:hypothetical protein
VNVAKLVWREPFIKKAAQGVERDVVDGVVIEVFASNNCCTAPSFETECEYGIAECMRVLMAWAG